MPLVRDRAVPLPEIEELCRLAVWAPNHKRTWPWRFAVAEGTARSLLGEVVADCLRQSGSSEERAQKVSHKYLRAPSIVAVGSVPGDGPWRTAENRDATAAAVQNFLLAASAKGIATYWSSCPAEAQSAVAELCGLPAGSFVVAIIYVGWGHCEAATPSRPSPVIYHLPAL